MLILSSPTINPVYVQHKRIWESYMNSDPRIQCYFIEYHETLDKIIHGNIFYTKGVESYHPGCRDKTIEALDYFMNRDPYDYIIRTNLSSLWNFRALLNYLPTLPKEKVYAGIIGKYKHAENFYISGSGFIMSPDVAQLLLAHRAQCNETNIVDDVDIGNVLTKLGVPLLLGRRTDFYSMNMYDKYKYDDTVYHYRVNSETQRYVEPVIMTKLLESINKSV